MMAAYAEHTKHTRARAGRTLPAMTLRPYTVRLVRIALTTLMGVCVMASPHVAHAGFGVTPPYVNNHRLTRGSVFEQRIMLVRSDPVDDLRAQITMNIPDAEEWFSIDVGKEFVMPKGVTQVPVTITVQVPEDAPYKEYKGAIRVRTSSVGGERSGTGVSIALGAQIDVDIEVVDKIFDFTIRRIRLVDLEEGRTRWGLFFPGKIRFFMTVQNTGNTEYGPTKVRFEIFDSEMETLLETTHNTNRIERVAPFATKEVLAELPTRLPAGRYAARYTIFKDEEIASQDRITLSVLAAGSIPGYEGYGFDGLTLAEKIKVALALGVPLVLLLILVGVLVSKRRTRRQHHSRAGQS